MPVSFDQKLCLFVFRFITLKQLKSTLIDTFSSFGGLEVTHQTAVPEVLGSIPAAKNEFMFFVIVVYLLCLSPKHYYL